MQRSMRSSPEITSFWRFAVLFALFIAALGLLPHVLFSLNLGGLYYMNSAWDEDSYTSAALRHSVILYRTLGAWIFRGAIGGLGLDGGLVVMDGVAPFVSAIIAAAISYRIGFRTRSSLFLSSCLLLFALEFLALCNSMMVGPLTQLLPFSSLFYPDWVRIFVPNLYENFFNLFKSPEPQVTFIIHLAALYLLLRHAQTLYLRYAILLALLALSFPFIYVSTGIALILCMGLYAVAGLLLTQRRAFWWMLVSAGAAAGIYLYCFLHGSAANQADGFVFASHLPIFSVSMLWGGALILLYMRHWGQNLYTRAWLKECPAPVMLALVCCVLPFITLNQQIITGMMVQSRTWEYYTNLTFTALAVLLLWPLIDIHLTRRIPQRLRRLARYAGRVLLVLLVLSQLANFMKYTRANMDNLITAQLLNEQKANHPKGLPPVILEASSDDAQVGLRMGVPDMQFVAGYQQSFEHPIALLLAGNDAYTNSYFAVRDEAFTYFDRLGITQDEFRKRLDAASTKAMGNLEVARFFSYMDCWKPLSDYRNQNIAGMKEKLPMIVSDYGAFLKNPSRRNQYGEMWLATRKPHAMREDAAWKESVLTTRKLGMFFPTTVTIYKMTPR